MLNLLLCYDNIACLYISCHASIYFNVYFSNNMHNCTYRSNL